MPQEEAWLLKEKYHGVKSDAFYADCKRLALGEPLAYLIGWSPFLDTKIWLDSKPLIPRPETEYWVKEAITMLETQSPNLGFLRQPQHILDLCAGSGCIGVAIAHALQDIYVDFAEVDSSYLATIEKNLTENGIGAERTRTFHSDLFSALNDRYDHIFTNPPYLDERLQRVDAHVKEHEPYVALFGGRGGFEVIARIIAAAPAHLSPGGQLWIEHEPEHGPLIATEAQTHHFVASTHKDQFGVDRYSVLVLQ